MPILWILLAFLALLIWGNLSRKSACHPLNTTGAVNAFTPVCSTKNTVGDNFGSGCTFTPGVPEPTLPLTCHGGILSVVCHPIIAHFPVDPPPIAIQRPVISCNHILAGPASGVGFPQPSPVATVPAPKPIFPVAVGSHPAPVITRIAVQTNNPVLLPQTKLQPAVNPWQPGSFQAYAWDRLQATGKNVKAIAVNIDPHISGSGAVVKSGGAVPMGFHIGGTCGILGFGGGGLSC
jgi:hypothetical protein